MHEPLQLCVQFAPNFPLLDKIFPAKEYLSTIFDSQKI